MNLNFSQQKTELVSTNMENVSWVWARRGGTGYGPNRSVSLHVKSKKTLGDKEDGKICSFFKRQLWITVTHWAITENVEYAFWRDLWWHFTALTPRHPFPVSYNTMAYKSHTLMFILCQNTKNAWLGMIHDRQTRFRFYLKGYLVFQGQAFFVLFFGELQLLQSYTMLRAFCRLFQNKQMKILEIRLQRTEVLSS